MPATITFFATCPKNLEGLLETELQQLGGTHTKQTVAGVTFEGSLEIAYRACLWSRLANRILLPLKKVKAQTADELYAGVKSINWLEHMQPTNTFVIDFAGTSSGINNTYFGAQKVKDAIVDYIRTKTNVRPDIDKNNPQIRINAYLHNDIATICIDLSGESLHRRGYRANTGKAPLKENLAAAILYRANWLEFAKKGMPLLDPMCGSGTILIEAAMMAADVAPGLLRHSFGFDYWLQHQVSLWDKLVKEAKERRIIGVESLTAEIRGYDVKPFMVKTAQTNVENAGLDDCIAIIVKEMSRFTPPTHHGNQVGLIVTNPPYGERLGDVEQLAQLYTDFGKILRKRFQNWEVAVLTGNPNLGSNLRLHAHKHYSFFNGAIPCKLLLFKIDKSMSAFA